MYTVSIAMIVKDLSMVGQTKILIGTHKSQLKMTQYRRLIH